MSNTSGRESHLPRIEGLTSDLFQESQRLMRTVSEIHERLFGPRPPGDASNKVQTEPPGFFERHDASLSAILSTLRATSADAESIASDLGIAVSDAPHAVRATR